MTTDILGPANAANSVTVRPGDTRVFASLDSWFRDCTNDTVNDGTDITAAWLNGTTAALRAMWRANGLMNDGATPIVPELGSDDNGIAKAVQQMIQRGQVVFAVDTSGTPGIITASLVPAAVELKRGLRVMIMVANNNPGAVQFNLNGIGLKPVTRRDGTALLDSDLVANGIAELVYDGTKWQAPSAWGRPQLVRNTTIYVRPDGNDANDGTVNDSSHALLTLQGAINLAFRYGPSQYTISIIMAAGTYAAGARTPLYPGPNILIDGGSASSTILAPTNDYGFLVQGPNTATIRNVTVNSTGGFLSAGCFSASNGATLTTASTANGAINTAIFVASQGGTMSIGSHTFKGNMAAAFWATYNANISIIGATFTFAVPLTLSVALVWASGLGSVGASSAVPTTFVNPGNVTGSRYLATSNGFINSDGQGAGFFPGTVAGTTSGGGQYG